MEKGKVLLVDDNLDMLLIGQRIFTRVGYTFISARNGREGLEKARDEKPQIIILDYILPDITGTQFIKSIATELEYAAIRNTPIVILTARSEYIADLQGCFELGLRAYLNKPFGHRELVNVIENILRQVEAERNRAERRPKWAVPAANPPEPAPDNVWLEDAKLSASTIITLCRELLSAEDSTLSEVERMEIQAIYASSRKILKLIKQKYPASAFSE
jgi:DNA-binding response OmpR family regulator